MKGSKFAGSSICAPKVGVVLVQDETKKVPLGTFLNRLCPRTWQLSLAARTETLLEAIDTTTSIKNFLLTSVERVTCRTYVQVHGA